MIPLQLTGILTSDVGRPRCDGTRGSGLYEVPVGLNRTPDDFERERLNYHWDHPTSSTTTHRKGILRVYSDRLVLDRTTMEEVERFHRITLDLVIEKTNGEAAAYRANQEATKKEQAARDREHDRHVEDVAERIRFGET